MCYTASMNGICTVSQCAKTVFSREWCQQHYTRWLRHGDPLADKRRVRGVCALPECSRAHDGNGWCRNHNERWKKYGDPRGMSILRSSEHIRFWAKVDRHGSVPAGKPELGRCWLWTGEVNNKGYGRFKRKSRGMEVAHRFSYVTAHGEVPDGLCLDHLCRVRNCVRPSHLEAVTLSVNVLRGYEARRGQCLA